MPERTMTIALMSPGDMGHTVGRLLARNGCRIITCLAGRSDRTRTLAEEAGIEPVADDAALVREADLLLSIVAPAAAPDLARRVAAAIPAGASFAYVDCNAVAPGTARAMAAVIEAAGGRFVDAGIIGPPPRADSSNTRFYASGKHAAAFEALTGFGLDVRVVSDRPGDASAVKMCYASLTKGTTALMTQLLVAAERLGVTETLLAEFGLSQSAMYERMQRQVPAMVPKAHRWVGEMCEIARTFEAAGLPAETFEGVAKLYAQVAAAPIGKISQEAWNRDPMGCAEVVEALAGAEESAATAAE